MSDDFDGVDEWGAEITPGAPPNKKKFETIPINCMR